MEDPPALRAGISHHSVQIGRAVRRWGVVAPSFLNAPLQSGIGCSSVGAACCGEPTTGNAASFLGRQRRSDDQMIKELFGKISRFSIQHVD